MDAKYITTESFRGTHSLLGYHVYHQVVVHSLCVVKVKVVI